VQPGLIELELTESVLMHDVPATAELLRSLKSMGLRLSIDDFGTGYSSLSYLKRFPIDALKIDRSFVRDISSDPDDAAIVSAIISMAKSLKQEVVAEGVETRTQLEFLREHQCDQMQGFLFSRPVSAQSLAQQFFGDC
jgi:EAL domain-containing protein (putative c-di-GMP-specific phosphodiesterase class I)